jgi:hypothetical protein
MFGVRLLGPHIKEATRPGKLGAKETDTYECCPSNRVERHAAWELQHVLFSLGYVHDFVDEAKIAAAVEAAHTDLGGEAA